MQITGSTKRKEDLLKTASFFSKEQYDNSNPSEDFRAFNHGRKKSSNGEIPSKHSTHLTFGPRHKSVKAQQVFFYT